MMSPPRGRQTADTSHLVRPGRAGEISTWWHWMEPKWNVWRRTGRITTTPPGQFP